MPWVWLLVVSLQPLVITGTLVYISAEGMFNTTRYKNQHEPESIVRTDTNLEQITRWISQSLVLISLRWDLQVLWMNICKMNVSLDVFFWDHLDLYSTNIMRSTAIWHWQTNPKPYHFSNLFLRWMVTSLSSSPCCGKWLHHTKLIYLVGNGNPRSHAIIPSSSIADYFQVLIWRLIYSRHRRSAGL